MTMGLATDGINRLFSSHSDALPLGRDIGLGIVERLPAMKDAFIREAAGVAGEVPKLLRGEVLQGARPAARRRRTHGAWLRPRSARVESEHDLDF